MGVPTIPANAGHASHAAQHRQKKPDARDDFFLNLKYKK
jgi:hypothetical protein